MNGKRARRRWIGLIVNVHSGTVHRPSCFMGRAGEHRLARGARDAQLLAAGKLRPCGNCKPFT